MISIGLDLDNTILNYNHAAIEFSKLQPKYSRIEDLQTLKDRALMFNEWVDVQSWIYAIGIKKSVLEDTFLQTVSSLRKHSIEVKIVSHKTNYPNQSKYLSGERIPNLRTAALHRLQELGVFNTLSIESIFFCNSIQSKVNKIKEMNFIAFVDDLEKVLTHKDFPHTTKRFLYKENTNLGSLKIDDKLMHISKLEQLFEALVR